MCSLGPKISTCVLAGRLGGIYLAEIEIFPQLSKGRVRRTIEQDRVGDVGIIGRVHLATRPGPLEVFGALSNKGGAYIYAVGGENLFYI